MLTNDEKNQLKGIISDSLDKAEEHWKNGGSLLEESITREDSASFKVQSSNIPGHPMVQEDKTIIDEFIALVMDMRDSSNHLTQDLSSKVSRVTRLERIYYETSALLPAVEQTIKFGKGSVTEYLGDGILSFFKVDKDNTHKIIREVYKVATNIMDDTLPIVNDILNERYSLPPLEIGIGLSMSKALVTLMGLRGNKHPKAFGTCVFKATKLSSGKNEILTDEWLKDRWPSSSTGKLRFKSKSIKGMKAYLLERKKV